MSVAMGTGGPTVRNVMGQAVVADESRSAGLRRAGLPHFAASQREHDDDRDRDDDVPGTQGGWKPEHRHSRGWNAVGDKADASN